MDVYMSDAGEQEMKLQLRALDESLAESSRLNKLIELAAIDPGMRAVQLQCSCWTVCLLPTASNDDLPDI